MFFSTLLLVFLKLSCYRILKILGGPKLVCFWSGIIIIAFLLLANLASAKAYGALEFWFAMIKVVTIILMIILGLLVILLGVGNHGKPLGFSNLWSHGGFFTGGMKGFFFQWQLLQVLMKE